MCGGNIFVCLPRSIDFCDIVCYEFMHNGISVVVKALRWRAFFVLGLPVFVGGSFCF